ncbi:MAG TPA: response regulator transcription factor [Verrucomicrobiae bacterium]|nr:response regulator transcription factor [Verrucomicrobiae bacterium]
MRVLIVDDHQVVRRGVKEIFTDAFPSMQVVEAEDSKTALEFLMTQEWDLVLLDINLPGRSGLEVLEQAKRLRPKTPVLVLSAYPEEEFAIRSLKAGASGYLNKSLASDEILAAARKVLSGGRYVTISLAERLASTLGPDVQSAPHESLSSRELQVLRLIASARTIKQIAAELGLSEKTVSTYRVRLAKKLGLSSNVRLARYALKYNLVD